MAGTPWAEGFREEAACSCSSPVLFILVQKGQTSCLNGKHLQGPGTLVRNINKTIPFADTLNPGAGIMEGISKSEVNMSFLPLRADPDDPIVSISSGL